VPHSQPALLIFDGDCGFCTSAAGWISGRWRASTSTASRPEAVPWQQVGEDSLARIGLTPEAAARSAWWVDPSGGLFEGHRAIGRSLEASYGWKRWAGKAILAPLFEWLFAGAYRLVARNRHRLPGATPACATMAEAGRKRAAVSSRR
jgi:predicted DCC family thiol-disulfide oxidoreductase YuxK